MSEQTQGTQKISSSDMGFLCLMTSLNILNMLDRNLLSAFANYIVPDLSLSNTEYGLLTGLVFLIFYSIAGLYMGMLADTVNRMRLISFGVGLWSALTAASGFAWNFISMAIPRMFIGVGESILTPSAMSLLADRFPQSRSRLCRWLLLLRCACGCWRQFFACRLPGSRYRLAQLLLHSRDRWHSTCDISIYDQGNAPAPLNQCRRLREAARYQRNSKNCIECHPKSPALMAAMAGAMILHVIIGAGYFDQLWFVQERGFQRDDIAKLTGFMGLTGGVIGTFVGGIGSDLFTQKTGYGRLAFLFLLLLVCAPFMIAFRLAPGDSIWIPLGLFLGMFQIGAFLVHFSLAFKG